MSALWIAVAVVGTVVMAIWPFTQPPQPPPTDLRPIASAFKTLGWCWVFGSGLWSGGLVVVAWLKSRWRTRHGDPS